VHKVVVRPVLKEIEAHKDSKEQMDLKEPKEPREMQDFKVLQEQEQWDRLVLKVLLEFKVLQDPMVLKDLKVSKDHKEWELRVRWDPKVIVVLKVLRVQTAEQVHKVFKEVWGLKVLKEQLL
jgi:hypothetical protein